MTHDGDRLDRLARNEEQIARVQIGTVLVGLLAVLALVLALVRCTGEVVAPVAAPFLGGG